MSGKIVLSGFSDEYSSDFDEQIYGLKTLRIGYMEIRGENGKNVSDLSETEVRKIKQKLDLGGIKVSSIGSPIGKIDVDGDLKAHYEKAKRTFETANELGAKYCRIFSFYFKGKERKEVKNKILDSLGNVLRISEEFGVTLCHENEADVYGESPECCKEILDFFEGKLKAVFDSGNFVLMGYDPLPAYSLLKN
ncbi:MAG: sugar phosphate isomerase/epimerase, partial [Clostridia bacterium]|nr:sugar phosphate isomerase/epimerase [Clostridia bacterium]